VLTINQNVNPEALVAAFLKQSGIGKIPAPFQTFFNLKCANAKNPHFSHVSKTIRESAVSPIFGRGWGFCACHFLEF
jgi:hypothetical protein